MPGPITFGACDNGALSAGKLAALMKSPGNGRRGVGRARLREDAARYPKMYGWIDAAGEAIGRVSVKVPLDSDPANDPIVLGTFTFAPAEAYEALRQTHDRPPGRRSTASITSTPA